ncbi:MAG: histidine phosphotransferase family protein [Alphaproteobacteria bacterium]|nr:histidine phosphotransferase family protein [Alphaproteobacteria bacterium]
MIPTIDLRVAELLASRLCHDMVSPVGAVKTGVELFTEYGDDADGETMNLITSSIVQASEKLQFFRLAYGSAGNAASGVSVADAVALIRSVCGNQRTSIELGELDTAPPVGAIKIMLNGAMLAGDCLPRGGVLHISSQADGGQGYAIRVTASGERAGLDDELSEALSGATASANLTPRSAHAYYTSVVARGFDGGLAVETAQPDEIVFRFNLPKQST